MKTSHWVILGSMLGAIALQLSGIDHWAEATSPRFISGLIGSVAAVLAAMFNERPSNASGNPTSHASSISSKSADV